MFMRIIVTVLILSGLVVAPQAQTALWTVSVPGYELHDLMPVEADGDPATVDWLALPRPGFTSTYRVIAIGSTGQVCEGPWFIPNGQVSGPARYQGRDVLVVRSWPWPFGTGALTLVRLDRPGC